MSKAQPVNVKKLISILANWWANTNINHLPASKAEIDNQLVPIEVIEHNSKRQKLKMARIWVYLKQILVICKTQIYFSAIIQVLIWIKHSLWEKIQVILMDRGIH